MTQQKFSAPGKKRQYPNITSQMISEKIMADLISPHRSFSKGYQLSVTATEIPAEDSSTSMVSPPKKHAFGPLPPLSCGYEQIDSRTLDLLSLESKDEFSKYVLCSTRPGINL
jgi:hypothetical protein